ncbi:hypothetical protein ACP4OV_022347 [Aristida adscensionis]
MRPPPPAALLLLPLISSLLRALHVAVAAATNGSSGGGNFTSCAPATCGNLSITYPFLLGGKQRPDCGFPAFELTCDGAGRAYLTRAFRELLYRVDGIFYENHSLVVAVEAAFAGDETCRVPDFNVSSSLALFPLNISKTNKNLVFVYNCDVPRSMRLQQPCANHTMGAYISERRDADGNLTQGLPTNCSSLTVPVRAFQEEEEQPARRHYQRLISDGFLVEWPPAGDCDACRLRGGECRFVEFSFRCICSGGSLCPTTQGRNRSGVKYGAGIAAALLFLILLGGASLVMLHKRKNTKRSASLAGLIREGTPLASLRKEFSLAGSPRTHIFTYEELDEATDGFSDALELGVGGFGTVYKGTLRDGSVVAVKRLYKNSYKGVEQFVNEVDILSRLRHPNLVTLYGCTSQGASRDRDRDLLLVYEFVPNGTLADHLHGARAAAAAAALPWRARVGIAVETASALDYLHGVEPAPVVHRDVKTNNILLDGALHVKVADFGLSRLFPPDATHVSTAPQGTPGYVDPVYHQCYQLTDKSDVYSFGVVLVELISSKPAVDMSRAGGDVNLATMALHMIQGYAIDQLVDPRLGYATDSETRRTVDLVAEVAFRCLQPEQDVRPPISEVLDVLREAHRKMDQAGCAKDDAGLMKKNRDGSPDSVMYQWTSPSTTANNSS